MRKLIFAINTTLDGCCDHTKMGGSAETHEYFIRLMQDVDLLVFGRETYELMVPYWPDIARAQSETKTENEFARMFDSIQRLVVSRTLDSVEGGKTRIVRTDLPGEILRLKQEQGGSILTGGVSVPSQLMERGLVDEYHFIVHPIIAGEGARLLPGISLPEKLHLRLVASKTFQSGCVALQYSKV
jgi:dihydrofolate reductase